MVEESKDTRINDVQGIIEHWDKNYPTNEKLKDFYNKMTGDGYDNLVKEIKFTQP